MSGLFEKYSFQKRADIVDDDYGNEQGDWAEQFAYRGELKYFRGIEKVVDAGSTGTQKAIIKIRRSPASLLVTAAWRVVDKRSGETWNIRGTEPETNRRYIEFICESGVNDG